jgi:hypothetical protein
VLNLPDLVLSLRLPFARETGGAVPARWTILPAADVGGPFQIRMDARIGDQWVAQQWLPTEKPMLVAGRPTLTDFALTLPEAGTALRTRLEYTRSGSTKPEPVEIEVLLPGRRP